MRAAAAIAAAASVSLSLAAGLAACKGSHDSVTSDASSTGPAIATTVIKPVGSSEPGAPRPGMAWIPAGMLRAGTPSDHVPRVADEEPPGDSIDMSGFYIDLLPYPNESGAIPSSNVTRDEAEAACAAKQKRLCSELEWERACKGPENATYEYGEAYRAAACGTGVATEEAARRPSGEHAQCKSGFGVADMHGGVWEWTSSAWGRGNKDTSLGVLRGGNAVAGELAARCANAIGRPSGKKAPTMGFRCCAGPKNAPEVSLTVKGTPQLEPIKKLDELHDTWEPALRATIGTAANHFTRAWRWIPVPNEDMVLIVGCNTIGAQDCSFAIGRMLDGRPTVVTSAQVGHALPDVIRMGDVRHLRLRGLDAMGTFGRDISYVYGRIAMAEPARP